MGCQGPASSNRDYLLDPQPLHAFLWDALQISGKPGTFLLQHGRCRVSCSSDMPTVPSGQSGEFLPTSRCRDKGLPGAGHKVSTACAPESSCCGPLLCTKLLLLYSVPYAVTRAVLMLNQQPVGKRTRQVLPYMLVTCICVQLHTPRHLHVQTMLRSTRQRR